MGMTNEFVKNIQGMDKQLQGRIMEAITSILQYPTEPKGDTKKPLSTGRKGLWRYRIGDYRLVYLPEPAARQVTLIAFASRGQIYDGS
jgi:mRNA-degrading endonuclease RelE of RelBE toxin-antitoxin system